MSGGWHPDDSTSEPRSQFPHDGEHRQRTRTTADEKQTDRIDRSSGSSPNAGERPNLPGAAIDTNHRGKVSISMDPQKFDSLVKQICTSRLTRKGALRGLVTGAAAVVTGAAFARAGVAAQGKKGKK